MGKELQITRLKKELIVAKEAIAELSHENNLLEKKLSEKEIVSKNSKTKKIPLNNFQNSNFLKELENIESKIRNVQKLENSFNHQIKIEREKAREEERLNNAKELEQVMSIQEELQRKDVKNAL